jgi:hypothetical protein
MTPLEMALLAGVVCTGFAAFVMALAAVEDDDVK